MRSDASRLGFQKLLLIQFSVHVLTLPGEGFFSLDNHRVDGVSQTVQEHDKHVLSRAYLQAGRLAMLLAGSRQQHHPGGGSTYVLVFILQLTREEP